MNLQNKSVVLNIVLAIVVVVLSVRLASDKATVDKSADAQQSVNAEQAVLDNIATRTSIRDYEARPVEKEKIEKMLRAAMAAPTAMNKQPWHFVVVDQRNVLDALAGANPYAKMLKKAPLAIVVCGNTDKMIEGGGRDFWIQDASAATENLLLAAHAMGLGAVWTGAYPSEERCISISKVLSLSDNLIPLNMIVVGYPAEQPQPKQKFKEENISYNVDRLK
ncbi:nitroreductase family protein [Prevotella sp.]|uniref:nitroreductase family protein n=1 Tax=Prevotella sp. TaxID=59823 RepID=UPI0025EA9CE1|nr:nitroreductase family protein [Prevotella sp.]